jgi:hypothetical protein
LAACLLQRSLPLDMRVGFINSSVHLSSPDNLRKHIACAYSFID